MAEAPRSVHMTHDLRQAEYEALRATIRERGTARMWLILTGLAAWGALALGSVAANVDRAGTLIPLLVLTATFEISFFIHTGVERIGRYLQVYYEEDAGAGQGWETTVMAYGAHGAPGAYGTHGDDGKSPRGGLDPLFVGLFGLVAAVNFLGTLLRATGSPWQTWQIGQAGWVGVSLAAHLVFGSRLLTARQKSASQRTTDVERFRRLKDGSASN